MTDILMLIKTSELEFDDRLRKEILTLTNLHKKTEIRAVLQKNTSSDGYIFSGNHFKTYRLITRKLLPQKKYLAVKAIEMYIYFALSVIHIRPKIIWCHNIEMIGILPLLYFFKKMRFAEKIVWDQHELPPESYFQSAGLKKNLQSAYDKCDVVISANEERLNFVKNHYLVKDFKVILNLPHISFIRSKKLKLRDKYIEWCMNRDYFITSGITDDNLRHVSKIAEAIMRFDEFCLIVMGPYSQDTIMKIEVNTNKKIDGKILFTGLVNQDEIINLTDNAFCSIVFYNIDKLNNRYCAPNRLYQAVVRGIPLITGCNLPMSGFIAEYKVGYALNSDGRDIDEILAAIANMKVNRNTYLINIQKIKDHFNWDLNLKTISEISEV